MNMSKFYSVMSELSELHERTSRALSAGLQLMNELESIKLNTEIMLTNLRGLEREQGDSVSGDQLRSTEDLSLGKLFNGYKDYRFGSRVEAAFRAENINTVSELLMRSENELSKCRGVAEATLHYIRERLTDYNLELPS